MSLGILRYEIKALLLLLLISHLLFLQQVNTVKDAVPWVPNLNKKEIHINIQQIVLMQKYTAAVPNRVMRLFTMK